MGKRGTRCLICNHPSRIEIEQALMAGATATATASKYGVSLDALDRHRHRASCGLARRLAKGFALREIHEATELAARVELLLAESVDILEDARESMRAVHCPQCRATFDVLVNDVRARVAAAGQVGKTLRLVGELSGRLAGPQMTTLFVSLGVRDEHDLRARLAAATSFEDVTREDLYEDALAILRKVIAEEPELGQRALRALDVSRAAVLEDDAGEGRAHAATNGTGSGSVGKQSTQA